MRRLKTKLQANTSLIETDLGGGDHRHLGFVLIDEEYVTVPNIQPFIAPPYLGKLAILATATTIEALQLKD